MFPAVPGCCFFAPLSRSQRFHVETGSLTVFRGSISNISGGYYWELPLTPH
jgi:hypothetical protein